MSKWDWVKYYDVDLINTIVAKVETKIESITLLLKWHICNLNKWVLCKISLSECDLDQDVV
jgi:hypothetical protein